MNLATKRRNVSDILDLDLFKLIKKFIKIQILPLIIFDLIYKYIYKILQPILGLI